VFRLQASSVRPIPQAQETFGDEMSVHDVQWMAPAPFWAASAAGAETLGQNALSRPTILRFASDDFMAHYLAVLERDPKKLKELIAEWETWREAPSAPPSQALLEPAKPQSALAKKLERFRIAKISSLVAKTGQAPAITIKQPESSEEYRLKLYQPAHQRFYLVVASLVCGIVGFPDRTVDTGKQERVSFIVRRLVPKDKEAPVDKLDVAGSDEYAFVIGSDGPRWVKVKEERGLVAGEEQLPFFPTQFSDDQGHRRRVWSALIPVGKREAYLGAQVQRPTVPSGGTDGSVAPEADVTVEDPRLTLVRGEFLEPWRRCHEKVISIKATLNDNSDRLPNAQERLKTIKVAQEQIQTMSWYALVDFAKFLESQIPAVWNRLSGQAGPISPAEAVLIRELERDSLATDEADLTHNSAYGASKVLRSLKDALLAIRGRSNLDSRTAKEIERDLDAIDISYDRNPPSGGPDSRWPKFLFPLADPFPLDRPAETGGPIPAVTVPSFNGETQLQLTMRKIDKFGELIAAALPQKATVKMPTVRAAAQAATTAKDGWFVIRCLFQRETCGPLHPPIVSEPTVPFQMAGFFDPDAPARPIRIPLPLDTTPAGLRKFDKNTAFLVSDVLCGQMTRLKSLGLIDLIRAVLPWPLHKDLDVPDKGPCKDEKGVDIGMMCSISIPIVTICAMVLLMVIVTLLDLVFRWIPYFILCFPIPKFKGKSP
jgi:hypothetical protein